jgi:hypothetical protein
MWAGQLRQTIAAIVGHCPFQCFNLIATLRLARLFQAFDLGI